MKAPATTANLGPGFDCAGAALELWNELHVSPAKTGEPIVTLEGEGVDEVPHDATHLALRAFALAAPVDGHRFHFVNRIPLERGLGSSAATVAAGLVAGLAVAGRDTSLEDVLELGLPLEGHADNLGPALAGGVCLIWKGGGGHRLQRVAVDMPFQPIVVVPDTRVNTKQSRSRLPEFVQHDEAAAAAAQAALLGAGIASGNADLLAAAFHDRLHEPFRAADAPLLEELRSRPVEGSAGVTLSGSGPSVVVWARKESAAAAAAALEARLEGALVLSLAIAGRGTHAQDESPEVAIEVAARLGATA
ncbi:MAG TPA: homoserine kinase [Gaiellaceae bacterium]|nr:homoserine kinase [Gaiellaceae bacterium]